MHGRGIGRGAMRHNQFGVVIDVQRQTGQRGNGQFRRLIVGEQSGHRVLGIRRRWFDGIGEVIEYIRLIDPTRKRCLYGARSRAPNVGTLNRVIIKDTLFHNRIICFNEKFLDVFYVCHSYSIIWWIDLTGCVYVYVYIYVK